MKHKIAIIALLVSTYIYACVDERKIYHFDNVAVVIDKECKGYYLDGEHPWYDIYYRMGVFEGNNTKYSFYIDADYIGFVGAPYGFPLAVIQIYGENGANHLMLFDPADNFKYIQTVHHTRLFLYDMKYKNRTAQGQTTLGPNMWTANPIVMGSDGGYYLKAIAEDGNAKCMSCRRWKGVLYKFDGKRFQRYKNFPIDTEHISKLNTTIWDENNTSYVVCPE